MNDEPRQRRTFRRRGVAFILVLLLLSMTLGLSYVMVRSQSQAVTVLRNAGRQASARQAALTGMNMALKAMHQSSWAGVGTTLTGTMNSTETYTVSYTTGDATLTASSTNYSDIPYRVTLLSTGYSKDLNVATSVASYQVRAVVRLIPRKVPDEPSIWSSITSNMIYQYTSAGTFSVNVPAQLQGLVRLQGALTFGDDYAWGSNPRYRYHADLNRMHTNGYSDYRPFPTTLTLPTASQSAATLTLLTTMGTATVNTTGTTNSSWTYPGALTSYQIYPGGKTYAVQTIAQDQYGTTLAPDPNTNPLGIYYRVGQVYLHDNTTVRGTIVTKGVGTSTVHISGANVSWTAVDLPPLDGSTTPIRLPIGVIEDGLAIEAGSSGTIQGLLAIWDEFEVKSDYESSINMTLLTRMAVKSFIIDGRSDLTGWGSFWWSLIWSDFQSWGSYYFPVYLSGTISYVPKIVVKPDTSTCYYHWKKPTDTLYVPASSDPGLRWDLLSWTENP